MKCVSIVIHIATDDNEDALRIARQQVGYVADDLPPHGLVLDYKEFVRTPLGRGEESAAQ
jgi:hypothetical protein